MKSGGLYITYSDSLQLKLKYENSGTPIEGVELDTSKPLSAVGFGWTSSVQYFDSRQMIGSKTSFCLNPAGFKWHKIEMN